MAVWESYHPNSNESLIYYAGIGSRKTPYHVCQTMTRIARGLAANGFILRSGGAEGADTAFENGVPDESKKEIYLPWRNFEGNKSQLYPASDDAFLLAAIHHPYWNRLKQGAKKLHARNGHQVLGKDLQTPSSFVICWTEDGEASGGTGQAIRIANAKDIPVFNMFHDDFGTKFSEFLKDIAA